MFFKLKVSLKVRVTWQIGFNLTKAQLVLLVGMLLLEYIRHQMELPLWMELLIEALLWLLEK